MYYFDRVLNDYDPNNDVGPDAPVSWAEGYLAKDVENLSQQVSVLTAAVVNLQDRVGELERRDKAREVQLQGARDRIEQLERGKGG